MFYYLTGLERAEQVPDKPSMDLEKSASLLDNIMIDRRSRLDSPRWMSRIWTREIIDRRCL